jgi:hypothetical protein
MSRMMTVGLIVYFLMMGAAAWVAPGLMTHEPTAMALGE